MEAIVAPPTDATTHKKKKYVVIIWGGSRYIGRNESERHYSRLETSPEIITRQM
jgi:hypothetical protein